LGEDCDFSGIYSFNSSLDCRASVTSCPLTFGSGQASDSTSSTTLDLVADNVCSSVSVFASLTGTLNTYTDATYNTEVSTYIVGDVVYVKAFVASDVQINDISVNNLKLIINATEFVVLIGSGSTSNGNLLVDSSVADSGTGGFITFNFQLTAGTSDSDVFQIAEQSFSFVFDIEAELVISYVTSFTTKRSEESQSLTVRQKVFSQMGQNRQLLSNSNAAKLSCSMIWAILPLIAYLFAF